MNETFGFNNCWCFLFNLFPFFCFLGFCFLSCDVKVLIRNGNENRNDERMGRLVGLVGLNWIFGTN